MPPVKNVFDVLEDESEERGTRRAAIVAVARAKKQMGAFFKQASDEADFDARLALVSDTLGDIVRDACVENSTTDFATVTRVLASELAHLAEVMRDTVQPGDIAPSDEEGDGQMHVKGLAGRKLLGLPSQLEENGGKLGASTDTGDTYTQETVDLPKADESGLSDEPSGPSMDSASAGDENHTSQKPIDIPSTRHNPEVQDITEHADYTAPLDTPSGVATRVDADTPMQAEYNAAPETMTWNGTKDQATPVTSKWKVIS